MSNPWDAPPFPKRGNRSSRVLYESIGRALITWEEIETALSHLYAALCGESRFDEKANNAYGKELNFSSRIISLRRAASGYFLRRPSQELEGELCSIVRSATGYSHRRNDVAHRVVRLIHMAQDPEASFLSGPPGPPQWCLIPPHFREAKFISPSLPAHILTSREINAFTRAFWSLVHRIIDLSQKIELPQHALRKLFVSPPP